jgi:Na+-driven multidrug efflux pump
MEGCTLIWPYLCAHIFLLHIFGINSAILRALAMQWHMAAIIFGTLWCGALPLTVYFGIFRGGGLLAIWRILPTLYGLMQVFLILSYTTVSWKDIAEAIREEHFRKSSLLVLEQESEVIQKQLNGNGVRAKEETPLL